MDRDGIKAEIMRVRAKLEYLNQDGPYGIMTKDLQWLPNQCAVPKYPQGNPICEHPKLEDSGWGSICQVCHSSI